MIYLIGAALGAAGLVLDQWLKAWVSANIPLGEAMPLLPGVMELRTVHNYGAAWSSFSGMRWLLVAVTSLIVLAVLFVLARRIVRHPLGVLAGSLIISGGLGNIIDRVRLGYVVDMFNLLFIEYPVFNVADICVVSGAVLGVIYYLWFYERYDRRVPSGGETETRGGRGRRRPAGGRLSGGLPGGRDPLRRRPAAGGGTGHLRREAPGQEL